eukprot:2593259-Rhodomonas_salina.1
MTVMSLPLILDVESSARVSASHRPQPVLLRQHTVSTPPALSHTARLLSYDTPYTAQPSPPHAVPRTCVLPVLGLSRPRRVSELTCCPRNPVVLFCLPRSHPAVVMQYA